MKKFGDGTAWCKGNPVNYYLLTEYLENELEIYGISVEYLGEIAAVPRIAMSHRCISALLHVLRRGAVTPVAACDVIADWLLA